MSVRYRASLTARHTGWHCVGCIPRRAIIKTMIESSTLLRLVAVGICSVLCACCAPVPPADQGVSNAPVAEVSSPTPEHPADETAGCPSPVLPESALFLGQHANLELTITARRDGSLQKVVISKKSQARLYDEYTRNWVEKHWKMPPAKEGEPDLRRFIAPIVYPKNKPPSGGHFPAPSYPINFMQDHVEGLLIIEIIVSPSGEIQSTRTVMTSGDKNLDSYSEQWVRKHWKFPAGEDRLYYWSVAYVLRR